MSASVCAAFTSPAVFASPATSASVEVDTLFGVADSPVIESRFQSRLYKERGNAAHFPTFTAKAPALSAIPPCNPEAPDVSLATSREGPPTAAGLTVTVGDYAIKH